MLIIALALFVVSVLFMCFVLGEWKPNLKPTIHQIVKLYALIGVLLLVAGLTLVFGIELFIDLIDKK